MAKVPMQRPVGRVSRAACRLGVLRVLVPRPIKLNRRRDRGGDFKFGVPG